MTETLQFICEECGQPLEEIRFRDGSAWAPALMASYSRRKHGRILCMTHYRAANAERLTAAESPKQTPLGGPAWYAHLSPIQRELLETLSEVEQELEDSAPLDRLRLLSRVRQAITNARAAWGKEVGATDRAG